MTEVKDRVTQPKTAVVLGSEKQKEKVCANLIVTSTGHIVIHISGVQAFHSGFCCIPSNLPCFPADTSSFAYCQQHPVHQGSPAVPTLNQNLIKLYFIVMFDFKTIFIRGRIIITIRLCY